ncbi:MAG: hypothetical protein H6716_23650 [Polyangiaceae bacterium]|nr:hypothetical protein [Polyangiaceae bacterium]
MATSPNQFFRVLASNTDVVMVLFERGEVDEAELLSLIERHGADASPSMEHTRRQLEEFGIIERTAHADASFEVSPPVADMLAWLTRRQRLSSATVLRAYLDDIGHSDVELNEAARAGDASAAARALRELDTLIERVRSLSENNREAVVSEVQRLRAATEGLSTSDRFTEVGRLWERYLMPLRQVVRVQGEMESLLDRLRSTLDDGEQRFLAHGPVQRGFSRALARLARMRRAAFDDHHAAIQEVEPLYRKVRRDSRWLLGASRALARIRTEGSSSMGLDARIGLTGWRTRYLMADEKVRARMAALVGYKPPQAVSIAAALPAPDLTIVTRSELAEAVGAAVPIDDVLAFVLRTWPHHPLAAQLRTFGQLTVGDFGPLTTAEPPTPRRYPVEGGELEASPLSLAGSLQGGSRQ